MNSFHITRGPRDFDPKARTFFFWLGAVRVLFVSTRTVFADNGVHSMSGFTKSRYREKVPAVVTYNPTKESGVITYA